MFSTRLINCDAFAKIKTERNFINLEIASRILKSSDKPRPQIRYANENIILSTIANRYEWAKNDFDLRFRVLLICCS